MGALAEVTTDRREVNTVFCPSSAVLGFLYIARRVQRSLSSV